MYYFFKKIPLVQFKPVIIWVCFNKMQQNIISVVFYVKKKCLRTVAYLWYMHLWRFSLHNHHQASELFFFHFHSSRAALPRTYNTFWCAELLSVICCVRLHFNILHILKSHFPCVRGINHYNVAVLRDFRKNNPWFSDTLVCGVQSFLALILWQNGRNVIWYFHFVKLLISYISQNSFEKKNKMSEPLSQFNVIYIAQFLWEVISLHSSHHEHGLGHSGKVPFSR